MKGRTRNLKIPSIPILMISIFLLASLFTPISTMAEGNESRDSPSVKIGLLNPLTGPIAVYAPPFTVAAQIAIDDLNTAGGNFELVVADSGCSDTAAVEAAQTLVAAGVVGVAGAACSGASMSANAVLSAAGVVQVAYASTNPGLSDASAYPGFWRVVPSDGIQGNALSYVVNESGVSNPALLYMTNDYGSMLASHFAGAHGEDNLCASIGYEDTSTDFISQVQQVMDNSCGSVVLISYAVDGAAIVEELAAQSFTGQIFGGDGIAEVGLCASMSDPTLCDGIVVTKHSSANITSASIAFNSRCANNTVCEWGIYTAETYDAVRIIGESYLISQNLGLSLSHTIQNIGNHWQGASGEITFQANGDTVGNGFDICQFQYNFDQINLHCSMTWYLSSPMSDFSDSDGDGYLDPFDQCPEDPTGIIDTDDDGICDTSDFDDDNDGHDDVNDAFPLDNSEWLDTDGDGIGDNTDDDDDGDGYEDDEEQACQTYWLDANSIPVDSDGDGICDFQDSDGDNDGVEDVDDQFPNNRYEWLDTDGDGIGDNTDDDDDGDGWPDISDACPLDSSGKDDYDGDGICDNADDDDDNDGYSDTDEIIICGEGNDPLNPSDMPTDTDSDGLCNAIDADDDGDGIFDNLDDFPEDGDNDGMDDYEDSCPGYDDSLDQDSDGVPDGCDLFTDSDWDDVSDLDDRCEGFDDLIDVDFDGVPDGCDNWHPRPRHTDAIVKPIVLSVIIAFTYLILLRRVLY